MNISVKRAYDKPSRKDGVRILVERLWPRGLTKQQVQVKEWLKDVAPSNELRKWFGHDPDKWPAFKRKYFTELRQHAESLEPIRRQAREHPVTLVYSARDEQHNNALALKEFLDSEAKK